MFIAMLILIAELVAHNRALHLFPTHGLAVTVTFIVLYATQIYTILSMGLKSYRRKLEIHTLVREADDAMEESMRDNDDNAPLSRYQNISDKSTSDMTADELLNHYAQLNKRGTE